MSWCTIESDPGVFTELVETLGVEDVEFREVFSLQSPELLAQTVGDDGTVHSFVFLFKWREQDYKAALAAADAAATAGTAAGTAAGTRSLEDIFFAKQTVNNACATQAIINAILNAETVKEIGPVLTEFRSFAGALPPELRGDCIGNNETIRKAHNSFTMPDPFISEERPAKDDDDDDVFHFVSFVPIAGTIYELDGLKRGPVAIASVEEGKPWYEALLPHLQTRVAGFGSSIKFNLLAMTSNRQRGLEARLAELQQQIEACADDDADRKSQLQAACADAQAMLAEEVEAREKWQAENRRRRHNYVPFIMTLLAKLGERGKLKVCYEEAQTAARTRMEERVKAKQKEAAGGKD